MPDASVLIVEDELLIAEDLRRTVQRLGYTVVGVVDDGDDAITAAETFRPSLVLMDIKLRGRFDGVEAARLISERMGSPVIMLTSHADAATVSRASAARPSGYVLKPYAERDLRVAIELALHKAEMDKALRSQAARHASILAAIDDSVIAVDGDLKVHYENAAADALFGLRPGEATGRFLGDLFADGLSTVETVRATGEPARAVAPFEFHRRRDRAGDIVTLTCTAAPIRDDAGVATGVAIVARDITRETELLLQLARSERISALATIAGGIGHEIANPLMVVLASLESLRDEPDNMSLIDDAVLAGNRIASIVRSMREFLRGSSQVAGAVDLVDVLQHVELLARASLPPHIDLVVSTPGALSVHGRTGELGQVFLNLVLNAIEACEPRAEARQRIEITAAPRDDGDIIVTIRDSGRGIPAETIHRVFEPFYTTRGPGQGTGSGLGLAIVQQIVTMFGGRVDVSSSVGVGTTVSVALLAGAQSASPNEAEQAQ